MLHFFNKYNQIVFNKNNINIKNKLNNITKKIVYSSLYRKLYFRSLLVYISIFYVSSNLIFDYNFFNFAILPTLYFNKQINFYFKKKYIK